MAVRLEQETGVRCSGNKLWCLNHIAPGWTPIPESGAEKVLLTLLFITGLRLEDLYNEKPQGGYARGVPR